MLLIAPLQASPSVTLSITPKIPNEQTVDRLEGGWKGILFPHGWLCLGLVEIAGTRSDTDNLG